jgi:hypothetical protein
MRFFGLGLYWVSGTWCSAKCGPVYLNWRTGEYRRVPNSAGSRDLDSPTLARRDTAQDELLFYAGPQHSWLYYQSHRRARRVLISRCVQRCSGVESRARVFWREGRSFHSILLATGQRQRWTIPLPAQLDLNVGVALIRTRYSVFLLVQEALGSDIQRLYEVRWPKQQPNR